MRQGNRSVDFAKSWPQSATVARFPSTRIPSIAESVKAEAKTTFAMQSSVFCLKITSREFSLQCSHFYGCSRSTWNSYCRKSVRRFKLSFIRVVSPERGHIFVKVLVKNLTNVFDCENLFLSCPKIILFSLLLPQLRWLRKRALLKLCIFVCFGLNRIRTQTYMDKLEHLSRHLNPKGNI